MTDDEATQRLKAAIHDFLAVGTGAGLGVLGVLDALDLLDEPGEGEVDPAPRSSDLTSISWWFRRRTQIDS